MKKKLILLLGLTLLFGTAAVADEPASEEASGLQKDLVILYTSDVHCGVDQNFGYVGLQQVRDTLEAEGN